MSIFASTVSIFGKIKKSFQGKLKVREKVEQGIFPRRMKIYKQQLKTNGVEQKQSVHRSVVLHIYIIQQPSSSSFASMLTFSSIFCFVS